MFAPHYYSTLKLLNETETIATFPLHLERPEK